MYFIKELFYRLMSHLTFGTLHQNYKKKRNKYHLKQVNQENLYNVMCEKIGEVKKLIIDFSLEFYRSQLVAILNLKDITNAKYIRIGRDRDGGYVLLDQLPDKGIVYSFGIADDVSFDLQMAERNFDVFMYDHTIEHLPQDHEKFHFFKLGITGSTPSNDLITLEQAVAKNGHQGRSDLILKMDIEGAEWDILTNCSQKILMQFSQIVLELHDLTTPEPQREIIPALSRLNSTHQLVYVHPNNNSDYHVVSGTPLPALLEATYVRKTDHTFKPCDRFFPTPIDKVNIPSKPDIILGYFGKG